MIQLHRSGCSRAYPQQKIRLVQLPHRFPLPQLKAPDELFPCNYHDSSTTIDVTMHNVVKFQASNPSASRIVADQPLRVPFQHKKVRPRRSDIGKAYNETQSYFTNDAVVHRN